jgi:hypothetical protein
MDASTWEDILLYDGPYLKQDRECGCGEGPAHRRLAHCERAGPCPRCGVPAGRYCLFTDLLPDFYTPASHDERMEAHRAAWEAWWFAPGGPRDQLVVS